MFADRAKTYVRRGNLTMILSMTGFGRGTAVRNGREITVELRSVNSRYFEYSSRMPRTCSYMDSRLKKAFPNYADSASANATIHTR